MKKRGFKLGKRAQSGGESEFKLYMILIYIGAFLAFTTVLFFFIRDINNNTIFEKNYLARDTAMVINTLYASPSPIVYNYPENISGFSIRFSSHRAQIKDKSSDMDEVAKIYWYADVLGKELDIPNIEKVETIEFCKADVLTARGVET